MSEDRSEDSNRKSEAGSAKRAGIKRRDLLLSGSSLVAASAVATALPKPGQAEILEYKPGTTFPGRMGRTIEESSPAFPKAPAKAGEVQPEKDRPG